MAKKNDLDFLIDDIRLMSTQQAMNDTLEYQIDGIIVSVLERMGMETIVDTGQEFYQVPGNKANSKRPNGFFFFSCVISLFLFLS